jgi:hypothetical protein
MGLPAHLRKTGPGTGGRLIERNAKICARAAEGALQKEIASEFGLSHTRIGLIVRHQKRLDKIDWLSFRAESFVREHIGAEAGEITPALVARKITVSDFETQPWAVRENVTAFVQNAGLTLRS